MGVFVNKGIESKCREDCRRRIIERMHEVVAEAKAAGMSVKEIEDVVDKSYASDSGPYSNAPSSVTALAKGAKKRAK